MLNRWMIATLIALVTLTGFGGCATQGEGAPKAAAKADTRPNVLLIVADDMGFSDLGCFGGEIQTPNLDALAKRGLRGSNFCVGPTCSPTRSMLMSGTDNHVAGLGNMYEYAGPKQRGQPGYEGHLNDRVAPLPQVLRDAGYHTYMAGKWHLGEAPTSWPAAKGFERDFTLLQGGGSNWSDMKYPDPSHPHLTFTKNGKKVDKLPDDYFSSTAYSDFIMQSIDEQKADGKPFFAYLSYQAVHSPFGVPADWLNKYAGKYDKGYDVIRAERIVRMKEMGIISKDATASPRAEGVPAWDSLSPEAKKLSARRMEIYAAMLANMDYNIGRVLEHLKKEGKLDNTIVIFFSDNGAEPMELSKLVETVFSAEGKKAFMAEWDQRPENWGKKGATVDYGPAWAQVGSGPLLYFKSYVTEGGIRSPLIVAGPGVKPTGNVNSTFVHVMDIAPTLYDVAGAQHPSKQPGSKIVPMQGRSLSPMFAGKAPGVRSDTDWVGWELFGNRAIRQGDWKLVSLVTAGKSAPWKLYNITQDPGEQTDLTAKNPERAAAMAKLWDQYAKDNGVILTFDGPFAGKPQTQVIHD